MGEQVDVAVLGMSPGEACAYWACTSPRDGASTA